MMLDGSAMRGRGDGGFAWMWLGKRQKGGRTVVIICLAATHPTRSRLLTCQLPPPFPF